MSLYPTKTRLALLREVRDGNVWHQADSNDYLEPVGRKVTGRMDELLREGWVMPQVPLELRPPVPIRWHLTDAGRAVVDA